jgi:fructose-1-phosphate kinase PfkB-like protein
MTAPAPLILTLTGNLLAERTLDFDAWASGRTQRAHSESFQVGGKGINVARMLRRLGTPHTALLFAGGATGAECEAWLQARGFHHRVFRTTGATRAGTVVRAAGQPETTFLGPDVPPDGAAASACAAFLDDQPAGSVLAVCGSLPGWPTPALAPLREALARWARRSVLAVDTYGPALADLAALGADLVKINAQEFAGLPEKVRSGGFTGPTRWIVTDGPAPVRVRDASGERTFLPPRVTEVSPTGSGDVLFACVLAALYQRGDSLDAAVRRALPYAAANAAHPGIAEFPEPVA